MAGELTAPSLALLDEFTVEWMRGADPDPAAVVRRAPAEEWADLRDLIDRFLARQPASAPTEASLAYIRQVAGLARTGQAGWGGAPAAGIRSAEGEAIVGEARAEAQRILEEAHETLAQARRDAAEIVAQARLEAQRSRDEMADWADGILSALEGNLERFVGVTRRGRQHLRAAGSEPASRDEEPGAAPLVRGRRQR